ncbi:MAG: YceI family protein [Burkholderiales bacterium]|nr:YceI family protein [Burkholderiales bacterium]
MKTIPILALFAALVLTGVARAQPVATLLPAQSEIVFTSQQMGVPVEGRFTRFDARIALDPRHPETGSVVLRIDTGSATLGLPETDAELAKPDWFGSARFAQATFQSSAVKSLGGGRFEVNGKLAIKGSVHDLLVPVLVTQAGGTSVASGSFTIKRLDYKVGVGEWADTSLVANDVQVRFKLALSGLPPL